MISQNLNFSSKFGAVPNLENLFSYTNFVTTHIGVRESVWMHLLVICLFVDLICNPFELECYFFIRRAGPLPVQVGAALATNVALGYATISFFRSTFKEFRLRNGMD